MTGVGGTSGSEVRTAEVIAALCLATDLGVGLPLELGLRSTVVAARLAERVGLDDEQRSATYYCCLLFYAGCTADAETTAELFPDGAFARHVTPVMFGSPAESVAGVFRALGDPDAGAVRRAVQGASRLPRAARGHRHHLTAMCEVAQMLSEQLGTATSVRALLADLTARWDGRGQPSRLRGEQIPLPLRVISLARDATFHLCVGGLEHAVRVLRERRGRAFDPELVAVLEDDADALLAFDEGRSVWDDALASEPSPHRVLRGDQVDRALAGVGSFADLVSPSLAGHSTGVAELAALAAVRCGLPTREVTAVRRAGFVHDVGRVAVPAGIWQHAGPLSPDDWEAVRLHAYHGERVLHRSPFLSELCRLAAAHHERVDGSGYHRGVTAPALPPGARLLAAADAYHAMTEPRPHRPALPAVDAARVLADQARAGHFDADAVGAVLDVAGHGPTSLPRPGGLTEREAQALALLARGLSTKQVARRLGISPKTADRHVQNVYAKAGVSTRAGAAMFAMAHGITVWGELPMAAGPPRS